MYAEGLHHGCDVCQDSLTVCTQLVENDMHTAKEMGSVDEEAQAGIVMLRNVGAVACMLFARPI